MISNKRLSRLLIITITILAGCAFVGLAVVSLEFPTNKVLSQLMAVAILILVLVCAAALTAWIIRLIANKRDRDNSS